MLLTLALLSTLHLSAFAEIPNGEKGPPQQCDHAQSRTGRPINFCFIDFSPSKDLLVFFPGYGNDEKTWGTEFHRNIEKEFAKRQILMPKVLTISFGKNSFLASNGTNVDRTEDLTYLASEVNTIIQNTKRWLGMDRVLLLGTSMGGFNALQLFLREPSLFDKPAFACPALSTISPFSSSEDWNELGRKNEAVILPLWNALQSILRDAYVNEANWETSSPLFYLENSYLGQRKPVKVYLASVRKDTYGFTPMHDVLEHLLKAKGHVVERNYSNAMHCSVNAAPIVNFYTTE